MGDYRIRIDIRSLEIEYDTNKERDTDYSRIANFLKTRGAMTNNSSIMKINLVELYNKDMKKIKEDLVIVSVPEGEGLPSPVKEE